MKFITTALSNRSYNISKCFNNGNLTYSSSYVLRKKFEQVSCLTDNQKNSLESNLLVKYSGVQQSIGSPTYDLRVLRRAKEKNVIVVSWKFNLSTQLVALVEPGCFKLSINVSNIIQR